MMKCPVCKRELAPTLSICFACGAMVGDSVREELSSKIGKGVQRPQPQQSDRSLDPVPAFKRSISLDLNNAPEQQINSEQGDDEKQPLQAKPAIQTRELHNKKTSPTLVGFQTPNAALPEWRLTLQNSVRQRKATSGTDRANVLVHEQKIPDNANAANTLAGSDPLLEKALKRIEDSRRRYLSQPDQKMRPAVSYQNTKTASSFNIVGKSNNIVGKSFEPKKPAAALNNQPNHRLVLNRFKRYDTNKLPDIEKVTGSEQAGQQALFHKTSPGQDRLESPLFETALDNHTATNNDSVVSEKPLQEEIEEKATFGHFQNAVSSDSLAIAADETELSAESDELAREFEEELPPLSGRFIAGLFDLIICCSISAIIAVPVLAISDNWYSIAGLLTALGIFAFSGFLYLTAMIWYWGQSIGMRIFGYELIDPELEDYPTLRQSAVNSAVFLLLLPLAGIGLIPILFNEERRGLHDLIAGTLMVKEV
ncbi:MAG TPA: RDD family protein [Pyrinomonadaceae bacterium]|nr:RDD family protein [Pyrinomonadaceae bacterium]